MASGYWQVEPGMPARERQVWLDIPGSGPVSVTTAAGVFGAQRVDQGTRVLIRQAPAPAACTGVLDVGAGYGPISVAMALREPSAGVWALDVNRRALRLTSRNAQALGARNVVPAEPGEVPAAVRFDRLYSNPPVKIGRDQLHDLLAGWLRRLVREGEAFLVVKQSMGADSLHAWLNDQGYPTVRAASKQGYRLLQATQPGGIRQPQGLSPADLAAVNRATGQRWSVLGRLAGGHANSIQANSVQLLGDGPARAVLKIKQGAWWAGQLPQHHAVTTALRDAGYPAPPVLGFGQLDGEDRYFLATAFAAGSQPAEVGLPLAGQLAAAIDLHAQVQPLPERDWSAMITLFLNGGVRDYRFHPDLAGLAAQALNLVPHPVPALPGNEFVHGNFTTWNVLTGEAGLSAVLGFEGFGRGTRTIDLVALLSAMTGRASAEAIAAVKDRALAASDPLTFRACLAHRVLARLISATRQDTHITPVAQHARALLSLAY